jgi:hypothetical protein
MIWRGYEDYTYGVCQRCQRKCPLSLMKWDAGLLVCTVYGCKDRDINGSFELRMARELSKDRRELVPDPKLYNPTDVLSQMEHVSARAGTY